MALCVFKIIGQFPDQKIFSVTFGSKRINGLCILAVLGMQHVPFSRVDENQLFIIVHHVEGCHRSFV
jgi:hypothetical protein